MAVGRSSRSTFSCHMPCRVSWVVGRVGAGRKFSRRGYNSALAARAIQASWLLLLLLPFNSSLFLLLLLLLFRASITKGSNSLLLYTRRVPLTHRDTHTYTHTHKNKETGREVKQPSTQQLSAGRIGGGKMKRTSSSSYTKAMFADDTIHATTTTTSRSWATAKRKGKRQSTAQRSGAQRSRWRRDVCYIRFWYLSEAEAAVYCCSVRQGSDYIFTLSDFYHFPPLSSSSSPFPPRPSIHPSTLPAFFFTFFYVV